MGACCQCFKDQREAIARERNVFPVIDPNPLKPHNFKYEAVFFIGKPGAGVSTQCQFLAQHGNWVCINTSDLMRGLQPVATESVSAPMNSSDLAVDVIYSTMQRHGPGRFLVDGFPQSREYLQSWLSRVKDVRVRCLFVLLANESVLRQREAKREKDEEPMHNRFKEFEGKINPMLEMLSPYKVNVHRIEADGTRQEVHHRVSFEFSRYQHANKDAENDGQAETETQEILFNLAR